MNEINILEKNSILYYQGGGENIILSPENQKLREFYNVSNSYIVINALLMPGITNEKTRLIKEGKRINLSIFDHMDELIKVYCLIYSAMCKYTFFYKHDDKYHTYRADRMNTLEFLNDGQMYSFMSTNKYGNNNEDFHNKDGILLLEVEAYGNIEHVDVNAVLKMESKYPHEKEILFAPFVLLDKEPLEITAEEKCYKDLHGNPPKGKYLLYLKPSMAVCIDDRAEEENRLYQKIMVSDSLSNVKQIWQMLMAGKELGEEAEQDYIEWKRKLQKYLNVRFARIKYEMTK